MDPRPQEYPSTPPHLACRFTAFEVAAMVFHCAACPPEARATLEQLAQSSGVNDALRVRMLASLEAPPVALTPNPYFSPEQHAALLLLLGAGQPQHDSIIEAVRQSAGFSDPATQYLLDRSRELNRAGSALQLLVAPPPETAAIAQDAVQRLRVRSDIVGPVGHIRPHFYEHPADRRALEALRDVAGFEQFARKASEWITEREQRLQATASFIQVSHEQFPSLHSLWQEALRRCGPNGVVSLYVEPAGVNARTVGVETRQVILGSGLISRLTPEELLFVMGHELGHIRSNHVLYRQVAELFDRLIERIDAATVGLGKKLALPLRFAIMDWYQKSEFTCDRFGLLVCQDLEVAGRTLMKLAGSPPIYDRVMNWRAFADQGASLDLETGVDKAFLFLLQLGQTHPWIAGRAHQLRVWAESGEYNRLKSIDPAAMEAAVVSARAMQLAMAGQAPHPPPPVIVSGHACCACGHALELGQRFCDKCGATQA